MLRLEAGANLRPVVGYLQEATAGLSRRCRAAGHHMGTSPPSAFAGPKRVACSFTAVLGPAANANLRHVVGYWLQGDRQRFFFLRVVSELVSSLHMAPLAAVALRSCGPGG